MPAESGKPPWGAAVSRENERDQNLASIARAGICGRIAQKQLDALKLPRNKRAIKRKNASAGHCGDHSLVKLASGGGHWCVHCRLITRTPTSLKSLAARPCRGEVLMSVHDTHSLRWSSGVTWCEACGGYMSRLPRSLKNPCPRNPPSASARNVLRRLRSGLPPTTASYLAQAAAEDDWAMGLEECISKTVVSQGRLGVTSTSTRPARDGAVSGGAYVGSQVVSDGANGVTAGRRHPREAAVVQEHGNQNRRRSSTTPVSTSRASRNAGAGDRLHLHRDEDDRSRRTDMSAHSRRGPRGGGPPRPAVSPGPGVAPRLGGSAEGHDVVNETARETEPALGTPSPVAGGACSSGHRALDLNLFCRPSAGDPWSRRIAPAKVYIGRKCHLCSLETVSKCRGCARPICMTCARGRRSCGGRDYFDDADQSRSGGDHLPNHQEALHGASGEQIKPCSTAAGAISHSQAANERGGGSDEAHIDGNHLHHRHPGCEVQPIALEEGGHRRHPAAKASASCNDSRQPRCHGLDRHCSDPGPPGNFNCDDDHGDATIGEAVHQQGPADKACASFDDSRQSLSHRRGQRAPLHGGAGPPAAPSEDFIDDEKRTKEADEAVCRQRPAAKACASFDDSRQLSPRLHDAVLAAGTSASSSSAHSVAQPNGASSSAADLASCSVLTCLKGACAVSAATVEGLVSLSRHGAT